MNGISDFLDEAASKNPKNFIHKINQVIGLLSEEELGYGTLQTEGRLVHLQPSGEAIVIGDIHGDLDSLKFILAESKFVKKALKGKETSLVFLGDYGDRGIFSLEVYHYVLSLKTKFPNNVVLLQGNHEGPEDLLPHPHDLPFHLQRVFGSDSRNIYEELKHLFRHLFTAVVVDRRCIMLHGGVPSGARNLEDVAFAHYKHPNANHLEEILWSDPKEGINGTYLSPRGAGRLFGEDITDTFLRMLSVPFVVRGHEPAGEGYKVNHSGKILTLFSRKGPPYFNRHGAYLKLDLSRVYDSACKLESSIRRF